MDPRGALKEAAMICVDTLSAKSDAKGNVLKQSIHLECSTGPCSPYLSHVSFKKPNSSAETLVSELPLSKNTLAGIKIIEAKRLYHHGLTRCG